MAPVRSRTVVVAEELALFRDALCALCEFSGRFSIAGAASNGQDAWRLVDQHRPDVLLLDLQVEQLHALEIAKRLADSPEARSSYPTRCVILTNRTDRKTVLEVLRAGAQGYFLKSGSGARLLECMEQVLEGGIYVSPAFDMQSLFAPERATAVADPLSLLSPREYQVFSMLVEGVRAKEIAARLNLSPKTVDTYRATLMKKLNIHDVPGLVRFAMQRNILAGP